MTQVDDANARAPRRVDAEEQPFHFDSHGRRLFAVLHAPAPGTPSRGGWLFCSPFGEERGFVQRMSVEWARVLAAAGHWVMRFDYRGYGDSEGWFEEYTADHHVEDVLVAHAELERRAGVPCRGLWGIRFGATIATLAAARGNLDVALALWEPVVNGDRYMDGLLRVSMVKEMANTGDAPRTRDEMKAHLARGGVVTVEGHHLNDAIYKSIARIDVTKLPAPLPVPAFVAQISQRPETKARRDIDALCKVLGGASLELVQIPPPWQQNHEYDVRPPGLFEPTLRWVTGLPPHGAPGAGAPRPALGDLEFRLPGGEVERPVAFAGGAGTLRGILHRPASVDPGRPAILIVTPGFNCRTARYRLYVKLARELAGRGWVVLRSDPRGIGDSDGRLDYGTVPALYNAIETGLFVEDTRAAVGYLEREAGAAEVLLVGLCGGANTSVRVAALDRRVAGFVASELPFLFTASDEAVAEQTRAPVARGAADHFLRSYTRKLLSPEAWRRFFTMKSDYRTLATSVRVAIARRILPRSRTAEDGAWFRERLGPRANLDLVQAFRGCLARRIPMLCLFGATYNSWYFSEIWDGLKRGAPDAETLVRTKSIEDADPGFSLPHHTEQFLETVTSWMEARRGAGVAAERGGRVTPREATPA